MGSLSVDLISDSLFLGKTLKILVGGLSRTEDKWRDLWHVSKRVVKLRDILIFSMCSLYIQFVWPVINTLRSSETKCHGDPVNVSGVDGGGVNLCGETMMNGVVATSLSEPAGLASISNVQITLLKCRIGSNFSSPRRLADSIGYAVQMGNAMQSRIVLTLVLENGLQMFIQHGLFMITRAEEHDRNDGSHNSSWQQLFSMGTSMFCSVIKFEEVFTYLNAISGVMYAAAQQWDDLSNDSKRAFYKARRSKVIVITACICMVALLIVITADIMGALLCPNVHWSSAQVFNSNHGCLP